MTFAECVYPGGVQCCAPATDQPPTLISIRITLRDLREKKNTQKSPDAKDAAIRMESERVWAGARLISELPPAPCAVQAESESHGLTGSSAPRRGCGVNTQPPMRACLRGEQGAGLRRAAGAPGSGWEDGDFLT